MVRLLSSNMKVRRQASMIQTVCCSARRHIRPCAGSVMRTAMRTKTHGPKSIVDYKNNTINSNSQGGYTLGWGKRKSVGPYREADARITSGWFWGTTKAAPKSIEALGTMYFNSVGHNSPLLLNIPPNNQGTVDEAILNRVAEFGQNIKDTLMRIWRLPTELR